jgi:hypothetical protein
MAGLVPAIHAFASFEEGVDARHRAGHDGGNSGAIIEAQT